MKIKWLNRRISAPGPYLCLCMSEKEYRAAMKHLKVDPVNSWISTPQSHATAHLLTNNADFTAIVCLSDTEGRDPVEIAGLIVHESVHIWQEWCDYYGERNPAREQEAYAIQAISQELMAEYVRRLKEKNHGNAKG